MTKLVTSRGAASTAAPQRSKNPAVSVASNTSWAKPMSPTSSASNSNEVTMPKFAPAPRMAQNRSGFWSGLAVWTVPSASTICADLRWSMVSPCSRTSQPMPPAVARPPTPTPP